jgi:hypothetical protein
MNHLTRLWRQSHHAGIDLNKNSCLDTQLFADNQVIIATSDLQRAVCNLQNIASNSDMEISTDKTEVISFLGKEPIRSKICIENTLIERVNSFNYNLSYTDAKYMAIKISKFFKFTGAINQVFKPSQIQRNTSLKVYKTLARPVLAYGNEAWTIRKARRKKTDNDRDEIYETDCRMLAA